MIQVLDRTQIIVCRLNHIYILEFNRSKSETKRYSYIKEGLMAVGRN